MSLLEFIIPSVLLSGLGARGATYTCTLLSTLPLPSFSELLNAGPSLVTSVFNILLSMIKDLYPLLFAVSFHFLILNGLGFTCSIKSASPCMLSSLLLPGSINPSPPNLNLLPDINSSVDIPSVFSLICVNILSRSYRVASLPIRASSGPNVSSIACMSSASKAFIKVFVVYFLSGYSPVFSSFLPGGTVISTNSFATRVDCSLLFLAMFNFTGKVVPSAFFIITNIPPE